MLWFTLLINELRKVGALQYRKAVVAFVMYNCV